MKILLSALVIIASLSIAFAVAPNKGGSWCASSIQNVGCAIITGKTQILNGKPCPTYFKHNEWDGTPTSCLSTRCDTQVILCIEQ